MSDEGFRLPDRPADLRDRPVAAWSEPVVIPTYPELAPDRNPMFLEKRVYQGSSGASTRTPSPTGSRTNGSTPRGRPSISRTATSG